MARIASNTGAAISAVSGVRSVTLNGSGNCSLSQSNISGMKQGVKTANRILLSVASLTDCVKEQADKFPKLAAIMESRDSQVKFHTGGK